jgi:hypothetical protein
MSQILEKFTEGNVVYVQFGKGRPPMLSPVPFVKFPDFSYDEVNDFPEEMEVVWNNADGHWQLFFEGKTICTHPDPDAIFAIAYDEARKYEKGKVVSFPLKSH